MLRRLEDAKLYREWLSSERSAKEHDDIRRPLALRWQRARGPGLGTAWNRLPVGLPESSTAFFNLKKTACPCVPRGARLSLSPCPGAWVCEDKMGGPHGWFASCDFPSKSLPQIHCAVARGYMFLRESSGHRFVALPWNLARDGKLMDYSRAKVLECDGVILSSGSRLTPVV